MGLGRGAPWRRSAWPCRTYVRQPRGCARRRCACRRREARTSQRAGDEAWWARRPRAGRPAGAARSCSARCMYQSDRRGQELLDRARGPAPDQGIGSIEPGVGDHRRGASGPIGSVRATRACSGLPSEPHASRASVGGDRSARERAGHAERGEPWRRRCLPGRPPTADGRLTRSGSRAAASSKAVLTPMDQPITDAGVDAPTQVHDRDGVVGEAPRSPTRSGSAGRLEEPPVPRWFQEIDAHAAVRDRAAPAQRPRAGAEPVAEQHGRAGDVVRPRLQLGAVGCRDGEPAQGQAVVGRGRDRGGQGRCDDAPMVPEPAFRRCQGLVAQITWRDALGERSGARPAGRRGEVEDPVPGSATIGGRSGSRRDPRTSSRWRRVQPWSRSRRPSRCDRRGAGWSAGHCASGRLTGRASA